MSAVDVDGGHPRHVGAVVEVGRRAPWGAPFQGDRQVLVLTTQESRPIHF